MKRGRIVAETVRSTGGTSYAYRGVPLTMIWKLRVGSFVRDSLTKGLLEDIGRLGYLSGNPKIYREPFIDELLRMIKRDSSIVPWTHTQDEIYYVTKTALHRRNVDKEVRICRREILSRSERLSFSKEQNGMERRCAYFKVQAGHFPDHPFDTQRKPSNSNLLASDVYPELCLGNLLLRCWILYTRRRHGVIP